MIQSWLINICTLPFTVLPTSQRTPLTLAVQKWLMNPFRHNVAMKHEANLPAALPLAHQRECQLWLCFRSKNSWPKKWLFHPCLLKLAIDQACLHTSVNWDVRVKSAREFLRKTFKITEYLCPSPFPAVWRQGLMVKDKDSSQWAEHPGFGCLWAASQSDMFWDVPLTLFLLLSHCSWPA